MPSIGPSVLTPGRSMLRLMIYLLMGIAVVGLIAIAWLVPPRTYAERAGPHLFLAVLTLPNKQPVTITQRYLSLRACRDARDRFSVLALGDLPEVNSKDLARTTVSGYDGYIDGIAITHLPSEKIIITTCNPES